MKPILESWRRYLNEETNTFPYQIYCDMDGVLVDYENAAIAQINIDIQDETIIDQRMNKLRQTLSELGRDLITLRDLNKMDKKNRLQTARNYMYKRFEDDEEFWAKLPWTKDGKKLWSYISKFDPYILTAPMKGEGSKRGKHHWIENNLRPLPKKIYMSHEKYKWAITNGKPNILIDDFMTNINPWNETQTTQGLPPLAIFHTNTNKTIKELEALLNEAPV